jgi:hypothetical protein
LDRELLRKVAFGIMKMQGRLQDRSVDFLVEIEDGSSEWQWWQCMAEIGINILT